MKKSARYEYHHEGYGWYWHLRAPNSEIIASDAGFTTKAKCLASIRVVKKYAQAEVVDGDR